MLRLLGYKLFYQIPNLRMKHWFRITVLFGLILGMNSCINKSSKLYQSEEYSLFSDKVIQGNNEAVVLSTTKIKSNYKSKESESYSRRIQFKLSINKKDN
jgi:hypothetical protein